MAVVVVSLVSGVGSQLKGEARVWGLSESLSLSLSLPLCACIYM